MQLSPRCRSILSGAAQDPAAVLLRGLLGGICAPVYGSMVGLRNWMYDRGWLPVSRLPVPVICVGNLTAGGTGKTPMVMVICQYLRQQGVKVVLLSRGYQGKGRENDEIRLLREALPDVPVIMDSDRVRGGRRAIVEHQAEVLVLDDGFQHRRLHRDLDIVLLDCTCPFGYNHLLPRGLLREPLQQLRRADVIVLTRQDQVSQPEVQAIREKAEQFLQKPINNKDRNKKFIATSRHQPVKLASSTGEELDVASLQGKRVAAFAGIGNPDSFYRSLRQLGAVVVAEFSYADHHHYTDKDCAYLREAQSREKADWLVTTEKDWVKLRDLPASAKLEKLYRLRIELALMDGREEFFSLLTKCHPIGN